VSHVPGPVAPFYAEGAPLNQSPPPSVDSYSIAITRPAPSPRLKATFLAIEGADASRRASAPNRSNVDVLIASEQRIVVGLGLDLDTLILVVAVLEVRQY
jgi:hypothetical protein